MMNAILKSVPVKVPSRALNVCVMLNVRAALAYPGGVERYVRGKFEEEIRHAVAHIESQRDRVYYGQ